MSRLTTLVIALLLPTAASAVPVRLCFEHNIDYSDADTNVGDDFWTNNNDVDALGVWVKVVNGNGGDTVHNTWVSRSGSYPGCTPVLSLSPTHSHTITVESRARGVNNNIIEVYQTWDEFIPPLMTKYTFSLTPLNYPWTLTYTRDTPNTEDWWLLAAAVYANKRRAGGVSNYTHRFFSDSGPTGSAQLCDDVIDGEDRGACLADIVADNKYIIVHEMGHLIWRANNSEDPAQTSYGASSASDGSSCNDGSPNHNQNSFEYQSAAAYEGFAHYYAAAVWNDHTENDCRFRHYVDVDWHNDGTAPPEQFYDFPNDWSIDCEGGQHDGGETVGAGDYFGGQCAQGTTDNRGTPGDWMHFFWDLTSKEGINTGTIGHIILDADSDTWNSTDSGPTTGAPSSRMYSSFYLNGHVSAWNNQAFANGVHR